MDGLSDSGFNHSKGGGIKVMRISETKFWKLFILLVLSGMLAGRAVGQEGDVSQKFIVPLVPPIFLGPPSFPVPPGGTRIPTVDNRVPFSTQAGVNCNNVCLYPITQAICDAYCPHHQNSRGPGGLIADIGAGASQGGVIFRDLAGEYTACNISCPAPWECLDTGDRVQCVPPGN